MGLRIVFFVILSLVTLTATAQQSSTIRDASALSQLETMAEAVQSLRFKMSFVTMQANSQLRGFVWRKNTVDGKSVELLSAQNGPRWEALRLGSVVYYSDESGLRSAELGQINHPLPMQLLTAPRSLTSHYDFVALGKSRILGRVASKVRIVSKDGSRFTYTLWIDQQTHLMLQLLTHDADGKLRNQLKTTSLDILNQSDPFFEQFNFDKYAASMIVEPKQLSGLLEGVAFQWLPQGMVAVANEYKRLDDLDGRVRHIVLSDGLVDVSVYVKRLTSKLPLQTAFQVGAETLVTIQKGDFEVTVIGQLPVASANRLLQGIQFTN